ncbi:MAG: glycosyltransferase family 2 protein [Prochloraceae cyanobacterium]
MKISNFNSKNSKIILPPLTSLLLLAIIVFSTGIITLWFAGIEPIEDIFTYLNRLQQNPPLWLETPQVMTKFLFAPTIILFITTLAIVKIYPQPKTRSRNLIVIILLILTIRYLLWRTLATLNLSDPLDGVFSISLFLCELLVIFNNCLRLFLMLKVKNRQKEADRLSLAVIDRSFNPTVDILIPTYDEPLFILKRTVIGTQAIDYEPKKIYLLDDTRRPEVAKLAAELGCEYITRANNLHAKAGNLNNAIPKTKGEFIVVFDADFVPTQNFLLRTLGFFKDDRVALVQTPQSFYNVDPIARNLGLADVLTPDEEIFYRHLQPIKDAAGSVVCSGTSFVVRRSALQEVGGFVTDSLSEDYFTGIRLSAKGYRLIYLDEKLSAGLAAENIAAHAKQRLRWARGTLQAFFINSNPLTIPGLNLVQRLAHLEGILHWFSSISTVFFLLMPLFYAFLHVVPFRATTSEFVYFFLPYYLTQLTVFAWLNQRSRSAILSGIYSLILTFPIAITAIQVLINPFSTGFKVTPKGTKQDRFYFNWGLALPLIVLFVLTAVSLWLNLCNCIENVENIKGLNLSWIWSVFNLITIGITLLILWDAPKPSLYEWFNLRRVVKIKLSDREIWGITTRISEIGAKIEITQKGLPRLGKREIIPVELLILEEKITLKARITRTEFNGEFPSLLVGFEQLTLSQYRKLVKLLFCRPGQWKTKKTPGEIKSLWLLLKILLRPKIIFARKENTSAIKVSQI